MPMRPESEYTIHATLSNDAAFPANYYMRRLRVSPEEWATLKAAWETAIETMYDGRNAPPPEPPEPRGGKESKP